PARGRPVPAPPRSTRRPAGTARRVATTTGRPASAPCPAAGTATPAAPASGTGRCSRPGLPAAESRHPCVTRATPGYLLGTGTGGTGRRRQPMLSDAEQRRLTEIEISLRAEDPRFARRFDARANSGSRPHWQTVVALI